MNNPDKRKNVPIYFYYLTIAKQKDSKDDSVYDMAQIVASFSKMLSYVVAKPLTERKKDNRDTEKIVWLDFYTDLKDGNYDLIFKSAKYNHVRTEIDTDTMQELGTRKRRQDGDEERTHLCIRHKDGELRFLAVHESNHYGISLSAIVSYLNEQFERYNEDAGEQYHYTVSYEIMPGEDFLSSVKKAKTMSLLKLTVSKEDIKDSFMKFAGRTEIADEIEICLKRPKGAKRFPDNLIQEYFDESQKKGKQKIKKIAIKGTNASGPFEVDTELMKMKHFLPVKAESVTNEVDSDDFFERAQAFINDMRSKK